MKALVRLERGGYQFELRDGRVAFEYRGPGQPPETWTRPLLAEVKACRDDVRAILQARLDWLTVFDDWCAAQSTDAAEDARVVAQLAELAIVGQLPNYEDGVTDTGPDGWRRLVDAYALKTKPKEVMPMTAEASRPLPWA